ncbi:MAG: hypothetical protein JXR03_02830 [Cyclobacteriaceae bacterium]
MTKNKRFKYINSTLKFSIAGFLLPALGAILFLGLQMGLSFLGIECSTAIKTLWTITSLGLVITPIVFIHLITKKLNAGDNLTSNELIIFNIIEYFFLQCSLASLFTTSNTLCYVTDGQNGLEFAFTGWMAIPVLIIFSLVFDFITKKKLQDSRLEKS